MKEAFEAENRLAYYHDHYIPYENLVADYLADELWMTGL
jgi:hypothetical protein